MTFKFCEYTMDDDDHRHRRRIFVFIIFNAIRIFMCCGAYANDEWFLKLLLFIFIFNKIVQQDSSAHPSDLLF